MKLKKVISIIWRTPLSLLLALIGIIVLTNISPIYNFEEGQPFSGPDIYNPYTNADSTTSWTRANFHTHTHATNWINECEFYPDSVLAFYENLGYDLVSFSNHMELTADPIDTTNQIWVYEHGYNFAKHHNLVFGPEKVKYYDLMVPVMASQKQFKMDVLIKDSDFIFFNHPDRTNFTDDRDMQKLSGYRLLEADSGFTDASTYGHRWDVALSNGHYVPSAISDDLHKPRQTGKIARRCTFLNTTSTNYEDVKECLLSGNFYTMHLPDYGNGNWTEKIAENHDLPTILSIGLTANNLAYLTLSENAAEIQVIGQNGQILKTVADTCAVDYAFAATDTCAVDYAFAAPDTCAVDYAFAASDSYVRFVARFADGAVLMTNPFARWHAPTATCSTENNYNCKTSTINRSIDITSISDSTILTTITQNNDSTNKTCTPYRDFAHPVNWLLTILYNLAVIMITLILIFVAFRLLKPRHRRK